MVTESTGASGTGETTGTPAALLQVLESRTGDGSEEVKADEKESEQGKEKDQGCDKTGEETGKKQKRARDCQRWHARGQARRSPRDWDREEYVSRRILRRRHGTSREEE